MSKLIQPEQFKGAVSAHSTVREASKTPGDLQQNNPTNCKNDSLLFFNNLLSEAKNGVTKTLEVAQDPRLAAFIKLRAKDPEFADLLMKLYGRICRNKNFGLDNISTHEILELAKHADLMEETGLLKALDNDLPSEVKKVLKFRKDNPWTYNRLVDIGDTFPCLIDFGKDVAKSPYKGYITAATSLIGGAGFGVLCIAKLSLLACVPAFLPAIAIGAVIGFGVGVLLTNKSVSNFIKGAGTAIYKAGSFIAKTASNIGSGIKKAFSALKFW